MSDQSDETLREMMASTSDEWLATMLSKLHDMARSGLEAEADAMVDEMFARYTARVALAPEEHAMDYVHSYLHASKGD